MICILHQTKERKQKKKWVNKRKYIETQKNMRYNISWGEILKHTYYWYKCPKCGNPKMFVVRDDTILVNFPGYCKKCKETSIITREPKRRIVDSWKKNLLSGAFSFCPIDKPSKARYWTPGNIARKSNLDARWVHVPEVVGSNPTRAITTWRCINAYSLLPTGQYKNHVWRK